MILTEVHAQLEPLYDQYLLNTLSINPAYAGSREALSVTLLHRNQWTGFEGSPKTISLAMHAPMRNEKVGLGLLAVSDQRGISSSGIMTGNFAYRIEISIWSFIVSAFLVILISLVTIGYQSIKAALANPVDSLRYE